MTALTRRAWLGRMGGWLAVLAGTALQAPLTLAAELTAWLTKIRGRVIARNDPDYELWRHSMVWYLHKPERYPDTIIRAESEADVIAAVNYARESGLKIATRATGHNPARGCLRDGGVLLDTSRLQYAEIDAGEGSAWVEPGLRSEDFIELARPLGWSFPAAHTGIVGLGGYLIGGGLGWNMPAWDIACRSITGADIVLADGRKLRATPEQNSELLWAVRGAGPGFFGAVLRYRLRLFPAPRAIVKSKYLVPIDRFPALLDTLEKLNAARSRTLEILAVVGRFGASDVAPADRDLVCAVSVVGFGDSREEALALLEPVRRSRLAELSSMRQEERFLSYPELYGGNETDHSSPHRTAIHNIWTNDISSALAALVERWQKTPPRSPQSFALSAWGVNPSPDDADSAFTYTGDHYLSWYLMADEAADVAPNYEWMDAAVERLEPWTGGHYPNELNPQRYPDALRACFSADKWERLARLRRRYDPDGVFHSYLGFS